MWAQDDRKFIDAVLATSSGKEETALKGVTLWRAQIGHDWQSVEIGDGVREELPGPFPAERMKPPRAWVAEGRGVEGRVNPKGIPCLYCAAHEKTAIAELRPWLGALVSLAQLETRRDLRVLNCTTEGKIPAIIYFGEPEKEERERAVWRDIDRGFSQPVSASDDHASYAPTQILAEVFRKEGFDGIAYRSSVGPGHNIALFDLDAAEVTSRSLLEITRIDLDYRYSSS